MCDFGLARAFTETGMELGPSQMGMGSCKYASPVDVWAMAFIIVEMMRWDAVRARAYLYDWSTEKPGDGADDVPSHGPLRALLRAIRQTHEAIAHLPKHWRS